MHNNEVETDISLVRRLIRAQFPRWAHLMARPVTSAGTDNALYRLGEGMVVRLPRIPSASGQIEKEARWLPKLASQLPLDIPRPVALGQPGEGFPWAWSVYQWLEGETLAGMPPVADPQLAHDLAQFILTLHQIDSSDGPPPDKFNAQRGVRLARRDAAVQSAIEQLQDKYDSQRLTAVWQEALKASEWPGTPLWFHGDLQPANLLLQRGRLTAVIDFGCMGVGDPACDVMAAWLIFSPDVRQIFRDALQMDEATWARGRGWAFSMGLIALPYYQTTNPVLAEIARRVIDAVLAEYGDGR